MPFTNQAINNVKASINKIKKLFIYVNLNDAFNLLKVKVEKLKIVEIQHKQQSNHEIFILNVKK